MNEPKISVIIPLYNAEKYIRECLISVLASKFQDYEVLVVDDCSTDNSLAEVKKLMPHFDGRLKIFSTEKNSGGPGLPRNIGIENATGKYITFIDNDDMILPDALDLFFNTAEHYGTDVIHTEKCFVFKGDNKNFQISRTGMVEKFVKEPTWESNDLNDRMRHFVYEDYFCLPWGKFYRRDFLLENKIAFPPFMQYGEDYIFSFKCLCLAEKYLLVPYVTNVHRLGIISGGNMAFSSEQEGIRFMLKMLFKKIFHVEKFMSEFKFFKENPAWYYDVLKYTCDYDLNMIKIFLSKVPPHMIQKLFFIELKNPELDSAGKDIVASYLYAERTSTRKIHE